jgi:two-component system KDP operon response regulator KdpE
MPLAIIIDDSADKREMLVATLAVMRVSSLAASDGEEGLTMVRALRPDPVISDVSLPEMDGIQLMRTIRKGDQLARIPWIFRGPPERKKNTLTEECVYFLAEPFTSPQLAEILDRALQDGT